MKVKRIIFPALAALLVSFAASAQNVAVDYNNPKKYIVGGVTVEGNSQFSSEQIISLTGLQEGMEVTAYWWSTWMRLMTGLSAMQ